MCEDIIVYNAAKQTHDHQKCESPREPCTRHLLLQLLRQTPFFEPTGCNKSIPTTQNYTVYTLTFMRTRGGSVTREDADAKINTLLC